MFITNSMYSVYLFILVNIFFYLSWHRKILLCMYKDMQVFQWNVFSYFVWQYSNEQNVVLSRDFWYPVNEKVVPSCMNTWCNVPIFEVFFVTGSIFIMWYYICYVIPFVSCLPNVWKFCIIVMLNKVVLILCASKNNVFLNWMVKSGSFK